MADGQDENYESLGGCGLWFLSAGAALVLTVAAALVVPYETLKAICALLYVSLFAIIRLGIGYYVWKTSARRIRQSREP